VRLTVQTPTRTDPPYVPIRHTPWPTRKTPRWLMLVGVVLLAGAVLVALSHRPSRSQRAGDVKAFLGVMNTGIQSCAGGVRESFTVLQAINSGASHDTATAVQVARYGATNCSLANNELLDDLSQYQVSESLAAFHLPDAVSGLLLWASLYAPRVQNDIADVLSASDASARANASAALTRDTRNLDAQRTKVDKIMMNAVTATGAHAKLPVLPG
jgi:hypothetical protein